MRTTKRTLMLPTPSLKPFETRAMNGFWGNFSTGISQKTQKRPRLQNLHRVSKQFTGGVCFCSFRTACPHRCICSCTSTHLHCHNTYASRTANGALDKSCPHLQAFSRQPFRAGKRVWCRQWAWLYVCTSINPDPRCIYCTHAPEHAPEHAP